MRIPLEPPSFAKRGRAAIAARCKRAALAGLVDSDHRIPAPTATNPQRFVPFLQLQCHEAENLFFSDEVLADMGLTWTQACAKLQADGPAKSNSTTLFSNPAAWNRKSDDLKAVVKPSSAVLEAKGLDWTVVVGRYLGRTKPTGMVADFLGANLLAALGL